MRKMLLLPLMLIIANTGLAANGWVDDELYVPIRAGAGNGFKILHRGLKSGTQVEILEMQEGAEWAKVRYGEVEGYMPIQYVSKSPTGDILYEQLSKKYEANKQQLTELQKQLRDTTQQRDLLASEKKTLDANLANRSKELDNLKDVAADPIRLDQANRKLNEELSQLRTELDTNRAENAMLRSDNTHSQWLVGVLILAIGWAVGWILKGRGGKGRGGWA